MAYLEEGIEIALKAGVDREKILIDPGIGFGKTLEHNLIILNRLEEFRALGRPILLGPSRKKFIGTVLGIPVPEQRVDGTAATVALGIEGGARVLRVHDVARMVQVAKMTDAILTHK
jgi:dihydropteroate synthase